MVTTKSQPVDGRAIATALAAPFDPRDIKYKPQVVKNNRCLAMAYIDARLVQDRLDTVVGVENWQDRYEILPDGSAICRLCVKLGGRWISKTDIGSPSEQPDTGDRLKAAFSDALKRAAVKFGIGRYLYRLPAQWVDYDPVKKQISQKPSLPGFTQPESRTSARDEKLTAPPQRVPALPVLPASGQELHRRLQEYDAKLAGQKLCERGALMAHVAEAGLKAGYAANLNDWTGPAIPFAVQAVRAFELSTRSGTKSEPGTAA